MEDFNAEIARDGPFDCAVNTDPSTALRDPGQV